MRIFYNMASLSDGKNTTWSNEATQALIDFWGEEQIQLSLDNSRILKETCEIHKALLVSTV